MKDNFGFSAGLFAEPAAFPNPVLPKTDVAGGAEGADEPPKIEGFVALFGMSVDIGVSPLDPIDIGMSPPDPAEDEVGKLNFGVPVEPGMFPVLAKTLGPAPAIIGPPEVVVAPADF